MVTKRDFNGNMCSVLGFGCMRFPCTDDGKIDRTETFAMLDRAYEAGVNYYDTAYPYHNGESEVVIGEWLKKVPRDKVYVATKLPLWALTSREKAIEKFNEQLKKLDIDYVDYYLFHAVNKERWENVILKYDLIPIFEELQSQGKIRHLGFSFHDTYEVFEQIISYRTWDFAQIQYNYMDTKHQAGDKGYSLAEKLGVPLIVMEPIRGGRLVSFSDDVKVKFAEMDEKRSLANWALSWVISHPNVKVTLSGMSDMDQVMGNIETVSNFVPLTDAQMNGISDIVEYINSKIKNKCTGCGYCMPCPFGVDIPKNFSIWNEYGMYGSVKEYRSAEWTADKCRACNSCVSKCPQNISIPHNLKELFKELA